MPVNIKKPKSEKRKLPRATVDTGTVTPEIVANMSAQEAVETGLWIMRQLQANVPLTELRKAIEARLLELFEKKPEEDRGQERVGDAGFATYVGPGDSEYVADVAALLKDMTPEQIAETYQPNIKVLRQALNGKTFKKHVKTKRSRSASIRWTDKGGAIEE